MADVIDLRKIKKSEMEDAFTEDGPKIYEESRRIRPAVEKSSQALLSWSAYEYEMREHVTSWYVWMGLLASALVLWGILAKNYFFIAFVVLAFILLVAYTKRQPRMLNIEIFPDGIRLGRRLYEFSQFISFWIFERPGFNELSLETKQTLRPFIFIPLGDVDPQELRKILAAYLPEKEHQEHFIDQLARSWGF